MGKKRVAPLAVAANSAEEEAGLGWKAVVRKGRATRALTAGLCPGI